MNIQELKEKSSEKLITEAENLGIENASTLRRQEIYFAILKKLAEKGEEITGGGVLQLLQDGFGFLRAIESNYLPGADDIYVSPNQVFRWRCMVISKQIWAYQRRAERFPEGEACPHEELDRWASFP